jgi:hypothetical protein
MTGVPLSSQSRQRLERVFPPATRTEAERLLVDECGLNLPGAQKWNSVEVDRIRFAAMKTSGGTLEGLKEAIGLAKRDYRDLLVSADFGYTVSSYLQWMPDDDSAG